MAGRDRQHRACIGIKVVGVPSRQGAGVVLRANAEFVLPLLMMVSHVTEQSILPLRLFVAVKVSAAKHWVEGIAVVDVVDAQRRAPASLKKCADEPVEVRTSCRCQSKLLAINTVVGILLQQIKWDRFLVEICISAIVGRKKGTQRSKCDLGVYLMIELHIHRTNLPGEVGDKVVIHRIRVGLRVGRRVQEILGTRIKIICADMETNSVVFVRRSYQGNSGTMVVGVTVIEFVISIIDIPAMSVIVDARSYADFVIEWTGDYRLVIARAIRSEFDGRLVFPSSRRILGH